MEISSSEFGHHTMPDQIERRWNLSLTNRWYVILYTLAIILLSATASYLFVSLELGGFSPRAVKYIFAIVFCLLGIANIYIFPRLSPLLHDKKGWFCCCLLTTLLCTAVWAVFYLGSVKADQMIIIAGTGFLLPYLVRQCLHYSFSIAEVEKSEKSKPDHRERKQQNKAGWIIPADTQPDTRKSLILNSTPFRIKIKLNYYDIEPTSFTVNLTTKLTLEAMFLRFLHDQGGTIEIADNELQPYAWRFLLKGKYGFNKKLDPNKTLRENGIKEGRAVLIDRIKQA